MELESSFITTFTRALHLSLSRDRQIKSTSPHPIFPWPILILSYHCRPEWIFLSYNPTNNLHVFLLSLTRPTCPTIAVFLHLFILIILGEEYKLPGSSLCLFCQLPVTSSLLNVSAQVSHPYRTTGKIIVLYILIFKFFDSRWEDRRFWTEEKQVLPDFNLFLISSWIKLWFVTVVPKYLNSYIFSNDLFDIFMSQFWPSFWWWDSNMYLVFSTFISRPVSLLVSFKAHMGNCRPASFDPALIHFSETNPY
jgi:hypothetical protein